MRELQMEEYMLVAGGSESDAEEDCDELADDVSTTITVDGMVTGALATLIPGVGPLAGVAIAGLSTIAGDMLADEVRDACEKHKEKANQ